MASCTQITVESAYVPTANIVINNTHLMTSVGSAFPDCPIRITDGTIIECWVEYSNLGDAHGYGIIRTDFIKDGTIAYSYNTDISIGANFNSGMKKVIEFNPSIGTYDVTSVLV